MFGIFTVVSNFFQIYHDLLDVNNLNLKLPFRIVESHISINYRSSFYLNSKRHKNLRIKISRAEHAGSSRKQVKKKRNNTGKKLALKRESVCVLGSMSSLISFEFSVHICVFRHQSILASEVLDIGAS